MSTDPQRTFTGLERRRKTSWTVSVGDRIAHGMVAVGGIGTIAAVLLVCVYLVSQVLPLFLPAKVESARELTGAVAAATAAKNAKSPIRLGIDEFGTLGWALYADGHVRCFRLDNGHVLSNLTPAQSHLAGMSAVALSTDGQQAVFGFRDGKLQTGRINFETRFVESKDVPAPIRDLAVGALAEWDGGLVARTPTGQFRRQKLLVALDDPIVAGGKQEAAIQLADRVESASGAVFGWYTAADSHPSAQHDGSPPIGKLRVASVETRHDLLSGEDVSTLSTPVELALPGRRAVAAQIPSHFRPRRLSLRGMWESGRLLQHHEIRDPRPSAAR